MFMIEICNTQVRRVDKKQESKSVLPYSSTNKLDPFGATLDESDTRKFSDHLADPDELEGSDLPSLDRPFLVGRDASHLWGRRARGLCADRQFLVFFGIAGRGCGATTASPGDDWHFDVAR